MTASSYTMLSALLLVGSMATLQAGSATGGVPGARETIEDLQATAAAASDVAFQISQMRSWEPESHSWKLMMLRDDINKMGREVKDLEAERENLAPWEKQALDKAEPLLKESAAKTESAIQNFNENRLRQWKEYSDEVSVASEDAGQAAKMLRNYLKFSKVHDQEHQLEQNLGMAGN